ncbi:MAG: tetratricopeptide repeat protein [Bryobacteraceae bacterium]
MVEPESKDRWLWAGLWGETREVAPVETPGPPASAVEDPAVSYWVRGRSAFDAGLYQEALESYEKVLALRPNHRPSSFNAASCLERLDRHPEAEAAYRKALDGLPAPAEANLCLGQSLLRAGKDSEAVLAFGQCLDQKPGWGPAILGKAIALHRLGRVDDALVCYEAIPSSDDNYTRVLANLIAIAAARNDTAKLREYGEELLKLRRQSPSALAALIQAEMAAGDYKAATQHGLRLINCSPDSYEAWVNLGLCYQKTNRPEQAAQAYTEAIKIQPEATPAHSNMGVILQDHGDISGARREFERVLEIEPDNVFSLCNLAIMREKDGQVDGAEKIYLHLIRERKIVFNAAFRLGLLLLERKNHIGSAEAFELCVRERGGDIAARINLSLARWRSGARESAAATLQQVLARDPDSVAGLGLSATLSIEAADWRAASQVETQLAKLGEDTSLLAFNIGVLQQRQGLYQEAADSFRRASYQRPGFAEALVNAGHALKESGQPGEAITAWKAALEAKPELAENYFKTRTASTAV